MEKNSFDKITKIFYIIWTLIGIFIIILLLAILNPFNEIETQEVHQDSYTLGEVVNFGKLDFGILDYKFIDSYMVRNEWDETNYTAGEGKKFLFLDTYAKNKGENNSISVPSGIYVIDRPNQYDAKILLEYPEWVEPYSFGRVILPGIEERGWLIYVIPKEMKIEDTTVAVDFHYFIAEWKLE